MTTNEKLGLIKQLDHMLLADDQINERIIQIYRLALMLKIDGKVSKEELQFLKKHSHCLRLAT